MASAAGARRQPARPPIKQVREIPTVQDLWDQDLALRDEYSSKEIRYNKNANQRVSVWRGDITTIAADVIVNAANRSLLGGGGVDGAIHSAAGYGLYRECKTLGGAETGETKMTGAYNLPCKAIAHTVGPIYSSEHDTECRALLRRCYRGSLLLSAQEGARSVAFSSISTGIYGYPFLQAAHVALSEARRWVERYSEIDRIVFVVFSVSDECRYLDLIPLYFPGPPDDDPEFAQLEEAAREAEGARQKEGSTSNTATTSDSVEPEAPANTDAGRPAAQEEAVNATPARIAVGEDGEVRPGIESSERSVPSARHDAGVDKAEIKAPSSPTHPSTTSNDIQASHPCTSTEGSSNQALDPANFAQKAEGQAVPAEESESSVKDEAAENDGKLKGQIEETSSDTLLGDRVEEAALDRDITGVTEEDADWIKVEKDPEDMDTPAGLRTPNKSENDIDWPASSQTLVEEDGNIKKDAMPFITVKVEDEEEGVDKVKEVDAKTNAAGKGDSDDATK